MELNYLKAFFEVASSGSFTEAARRLHISQSALSKAVALLEDSQGVIVRNTYEATDFSPLVGGESQRLGTEHERSISF